MKFSASVSMDSPKPTQENLEKLRAEISQLRALGLCEKDSTALQLMLELERGFASEVRDAEMGLCEVEFSYKIIPTAKNVTKKTFLKVPNAEIERLGLPSKLLGPIYMSETHYYLDWYALDLFYKARTKEGLPVFRIPTVRVTGDIRGKRGIVEVVDLAHILQGKKEGKVPNRPAAVLRT
jgi:hypothetical protein